MAAEVYRMFTERNAHQGMKFVAGMGIMPHDTGMPTELNQPIHWSDAERGALVITGYWHEVQSAITAAGGLKLISNFAPPDMSTRYVKSALDVNEEFDVMYGSDSRVAAVAEGRKMSLYISLDYGAVEAVAAGGEVVLNAPLAAAQTVASRSAGALGAAQSFQKGVTAAVMASIGTAKDVIGLTSGVRSLRSGEGKQPKHLDRTRITLTVDIAPAGRFMESTGQTELDQRQLLGYASSLMKRMWKS